MKLPVNYDELHFTERREIREEYIKIQNGKCQHCDEPLTGDPATIVKNKKVNKNLFPKGFFNNPIHLHHNHYTGMTVGAIHAYCNAVLWQYYGE